MSCASPAHPCLQLFQAGACSGETDILSEFSSLSPTPPTVLASWVFACAPLARPPSLRPGQWSLKFTVRDWGLPFTILAYMEFSFSWNPETNCLLVHLLPSHTRCARAWLRQPRRRTPCRFPADVPSMGDCTDFSAGFGGEPGEGTLISRLIANN